ncbi:potassium channel family protein [Cesiribacter sp. SM1]|uniref:potassium channel family protein n=1 Tax=Cesiribacter sp. SM1 TaxID=2861196 RepID=UPI001CD2BA0B|nr:potassium channel family protein [Cesiribacter sp. SM1]
MNYIFIILGVIIYMSVVMDIIKTTLSMQGGGWLTSPMSHGIWLLFLKLSGQNGRSRMLDHVGYLLLVIILLFWILGLWGSFFLILLSESGSIISSSTRLPADAWEKFYYAGFTVSTLGVGDFIGSQIEWRILTDVYALTGLVLITMSITYFLPVLSGVIKQRNLGIMLSSMGQSAQQLVLSSWDGKSFHRLTAQASDVSNMLIEHSQNHKAYPVIHYFHTHKAKHAIVLRIATLYDALLILNQYVKSDIRPSKDDLSSLQTALENYIEVITEVSSINKKGTMPELPKVNMLIEKGLVEQQAVLDSVDDATRQARIVLAKLVKEDGWKWQDLQNTTS